MITLTLPTWLWYFTLALLLADVIMHLPKWMGMWSQWWTFHTMTKGAWAADKDALERAREETVKAEEALHDLEQKAAQRGIYFNEPQ